MNNFESTLTSALKGEADRTTRHLVTADAAQALAARLDRIDRRRRQRTWRTIVAAAAAVVVAAGVYGIVKIQASTSDEPSQVPHRTTPEPYYRFTQFGEPGTYRLPVGRAATGIGADLTFYATGWEVGNYPVRRDSHGHYGGVAVYRPTALAAGTGCLAGKTTNEIGQTRSQLAQQLTQLPKSTVVQRPTQVQAFGQHAVHLQLRINPWCHGGVYRVAWTSRGGHGISYGNSKEVVIDFWAMNVRGVPVVAEMWHEAGSSTQLVDQLARTKDSISVGTGE